MARVDVDSRKEHSQNFRAIDLFCGCGGFSLGAARAGFSIVAAVDNDERAIRVHQKNFPTTLHSKIDLSSVTRVDLLQKLKVEAGTVDGVIGGPPCQGFSSIGRRSANDHRNVLFRRFFEFVGAIRPRFFLCENVPGLLDKQYDSLRHEALDHIATEYRVLPPMKLRASHFGAPTLRTRVFFLGFRSDQNSACCEEHFVPSPISEKVFVGDAIKGLPSKIATNWQKGSQGWRKIGATTNGEFGARLSGHIPEGVGDPFAIRRLTEELCVSGCLGTHHTPTVVSRFGNTPVGETEPVSRFPRLDPKDFCPTLRAGTGSDRGSHQAARPIHPTQDRVITVREAARLQGFPDWFQFDATKWHSFRLIGNSVSPILAEHVLRIVIGSLKGETE